MTDIQKTLTDGGIDADLLAIQRQVARTFDVSYETVETVITTIGEARSWERVMEVEDVTDVEFHFFTDNDRLGSFLWTAEEAQQVGQRAADLAGIHMECPEVEFIQSKYLAEIFAEIPHPDDWPSWTSPHSVWEAGGERVFILPWSGSEDEDGVAYINPRGDVSHPSYYDWVDGDTMVALDPDADDAPVMIHSDMMYEHTDPITIASHEGVFKFASRGGVAWERYSDDNPPSWAWELAEAHYRGSSLPGDWQKVTSGWHSSMERSALSEKINQITRGEFHADAPWDIPPVMVSFSGTGNVCSIGLSLYTCDGFAEELTGVLTHERAAPGHAGVN